MGGDVGPRPVDHGLQQLLEHVEPEGVEEELYRLRRPLQARVRGHESLGAGSRMSPVRVEARRP